MKSVIIFMEQVKNTIPDETGPQQGFARDRARQLKYALSRGRMSNVEYQKQVEAAKKDPMGKIGTYTVQT